jgi:CHASE2 domain-containing sensor protein
MRPPLGVPDRRPVARVLAVLAVVAASTAVTVLLLPNPLADAFVAGILLCGGGCSVVGSVGAWTTRPALARVGALLFAGLTVAGMMSVRIPASGSRPNS